MKIYFALLVLSLFSISLAQTCNTTDLESMRRDAAITWTNLLSHQDNATLSGNTTLQTLFSENVTLIVPQIGIWRGRVQVIDFVKLFDPRVSGAIFILNSASIDNSSISSSGNTLTLVEIVSFSYPQAPGASSGSENQTLSILFEDCTAKILQITLTLPPSFNLAGQSLTVNATDFCNRAMATCSGVFMSLNDCITLLSSNSSATGSSNTSSSNSSSNTSSSNANSCPDTPFIGNTPQCRFFYLQAAQVDPQTICPWIGPNSTKCINSLCASGNMTLGTHGAQALSGTESGTSASGTESLASGTESLSSGTESLASGTESLASGTGSLTSGSETGGATQGSQFVCSDQACCTSHQIGNPQTGDGFLQFVPSCMNGGIHCVGNSGCQLCHIGGGSNPGNRPMCLQTLESVSAGTESGTASGTASGTESGISSGTESGISSGTESGISSGTASGASASIGASSTA